jgi:type IV pilus assembly protein PilZ
MTIEIQHEFDNQLELNYSYMPFIKNGGIFIPTRNTNLNLGDEVQLSIKIPGHTEFDQVKAKVVWITPENAINHIYSGVGFQLIGENSATLNDKITLNLDNTVDPGNYLYGVSHESF